MAKRKQTQAPTGVGTDASGGPLVDPTQNVKDLTEAANIRQDDLRRETNKRIDEALLHLTTVVNLHAKHQKALRKAEAARLDSIRQVDREEGNKAVAAAQTAIATLAASNLTTAETLRTQVATTAQAAATSLANSMGEVNKRLSALELSSSAGSGRGQGAQNLWAIIAVAISVLVALVTLWQLSNR
jgi:hypothetical protein